MLSVLNQQKKTRLGTLILLSAVLAPALSFGGVLTGIAFWRIQKGLAVTTTAQTVPVGVCSGITTVQTRNAAGAATNVASNLTVNLATTGSLTFYSDVNCATPITSIPVLSGNSSANFYFIKNATGAETITLTATAYAAANQTETGSVNNYVWTGGGGDVNWSTGANWSGGSAPGAGNQALFDGTCSSNCSPTITANISVAGIRIATGYSGTITQNTGVTITVGSSGWYQITGTFAGGDSAFTMNGPFALAGGTFTNTSGTFTVYKVFAVTNSPTYNHNNGKVAVTLMGNASITGVGSISFYNVDILGNAPSASTILTGTMNVLGALRFVDYGYLSTFTGTATINVSGDLAVQGALWSVNPSVTVKMIGTGTITGSGTGGHLGSLNIATAGTITFANTGSVDVAGNFTYTSGTVVSTGSTVRFVGTSQSITPGSISFNHVSVVTQDLGNVTETINGTMTVLGDLTLSCNSFFAYVNSGTVNVSGNVNLIGNQFNGGTALIRLVGTGTVTGSGTGSAMPSLEIATAGTITFANTGSADIAGNFTYTSGTVVTTGSTIRIVGSNPVTVNSGSMIFNNLTFSQSAQSANTVTGTLYVNGNLAFNSTGAWPSSNGGTIQVQGNLSASGNWTGGTTSLVLTGGGVQTMTRANSAYFPGATITVNNASSVLTLGSAVPLNTTQGLTVTAGSVNLAGYALTAKTLSLNSNTLTKNGGVLTVNGTTVGTGSLYGGTINP